MRFIAKIGFLTLLAVAPATARADFIEGFDNITTLSGAGWSLQNLSVPLGSTTWFQGNPTVFPAQAGATNAYMGANFNFTTGTNTINAYLMSPTQTFNNGDVISFFTRTVTGNTFPDRLQLRLSTNGASTSASDFSTLLLDINPNYQTGSANYPETWTQFSATLSGLSGPTSGRFALRYFVENGGPFGANSNYIGIDTVSFTAIPEPASALLLVGLGLGATFFSRRRVA